MTGFEDAFIIFVPTVFSDFPIMNRYCLDTTEKEKYYEFQLLTKRKVDHRQLYKLEMQRNRMGASGQETQNKCKTPL